MSSGSRAGSLAQLHTAVVALGHFLSCSLHLWFHLSTLDYLPDSEGGVSVRFPGGLVARIRRFHRRGPGSIPGQGKLFSPPFLGVFLPRSDLSFASRSNAEERLHRVPNASESRPQGP